MNDARDIRITDNNDIVFAKDVYEKGNFRKGRVGIPLGEIVDFYCPECRSPVFLKTCRGKRPWFEHEHSSEKTEIQRACSRYTNADKRNYDPKDCYAIVGSIPLYLMGEKDNFKLRAYFPHLPIHILDELESINAKICVLYKNSICAKYSARNVNYFDIDVYSGDNFSVEIYDKFGTKLANIPEEVKRKWACGIQGIDRDKDIFHSWKNGGIRVAKKGIVYIGTTYRILHFEPAFESIDGIEVKRVGEICDDNAGTVNVYEITPIHSTAVVRKFFSQRGYILKVRKDEIIPLWPPAIARGRDLIYEGDYALLLHKTQGQSINKQKIFLLEDEAVLQVRNSKLDKVNETAEIVQVKLDGNISKPIMLGGKLTPMWHDAQKDDQILTYKPIRLERSVLDKNGCEVQAPTKIPVEGKLNIKSNVPAIVLVRKGSLTISSNYDSGYIEGIYYGLDVVIDYGPWGRDYFSFKKQPQIENWEVVYKRLRHCQGKTITANNRLVRIVDMLRHLSDRNAALLYVVIKKWLATNSIPISALRIIDEIENCFISRK